MAADHEVTPCGGIRDIFGPLDRVTVCFGLEAQGHIPTIEWMLQEGASWREISQAIGWDPEAAAQHYLWHIQRIAQEAPIRFARIRDLAMLMLWPGESSHASPQSAIQAPRPGDRHHA